MGRWLYCYNGQYRPSTHIYIHFLSSWNKDKTLQGFTASGYFGNGWSKHSWIYFSKVRCRMIWPPSSYNRESWLREDCHHIKLQVFEMWWNECWKEPSVGFEQPGVQGMLCRQVQDARVFSSCKVAHYLEKTLFCWLKVRGASWQGEETTSMLAEDCRLIYSTCKDQPVFQGD